MKVYIVQELQEYKIYKVADNLIGAFEVDKKDNIIVEGKSIAEVVVRFDAIEKTSDFKFNAACEKYSNEALKREADDVDTRKQRIKLK